MRVEAATELLEESLELGQGRKMRTYGWSRDSPRRSSVVVERIINIYIYMRGVSLVLRILL